MKITHIMIIFLLFSPLAIAHEESLSENIDMHMNIDEAFQNNAIAIEAEITKNGTSLESASVFFVIDKHDVGLSERIEAKEREPGKYFIKYAFTNSGPHEIHVEFAHDGEEIRKTFDMNIVGSSGIEIFSTAIIGIAAIASLYALRTRKIRRTAIVVAILIALLGLAYSVYTVYSSGAAQRGVIVCVDSGCFWSAHIHAQVDINICGEDYRFPIEKGRLDRPHTHEEKNLIHFHERLVYDPAAKKILDTEPLTLRAFFSEMQASFSREAVLDKRNGDLCKDQPGIVKMHINGKPSDYFEDYVWKDGDKIEITFDEKPAEQAVREEETDVQFTPELTLPIIVGFALIDSINPCVIGVLLLLITVLLKTKKRRSILVKGSAYTTGVYVTYLIGGVTLLSIFNAVREIQLISQLFYIVIGMIILFAAFLEVKDYFWYGRGLSLSIPKRFIKTVESGAGRSTSLGSAFLFGAIVTLVELPCTGAPYLAIITMMSQSGVQFVTALLFLLLYNLIFVLPLIVIIYLAYKGVEYKKMESWRREHKGKMRLFVGLMLLGISIWIITTIADWLMLHLLAISAAIILVMAIIKKIEKVHR